LFFFGLLLGLPMLDPKPVGNSLGIAGRLRR
jgi:hypothetical protein